MIISNKFKIFFLSSLLVTSAYADGPFYNCQSDAKNFHVSVRNDADGTWCVWHVLTGVTTPVGGYQPTIAEFNAVKFKVSNPSIDNCSPISYNASKMSVYANLTLGCSFVPLGALGRPQMVNYTKFNPPYVIQEFINKQWVSTNEEDCPVASQNCRIGPQ